LARLQLFRELIVVLLLRLVVCAQVSWLFSATEHASDAEVSYDDFKACYAKLLAAAYEEEVLLLDLSRAIDSLQRSEEWTAMKRLFQTARSLFQALSHGSSASDTSISVSDERVRSVLERAFASINGRSQSMGPKKQTAARRLVAPALDAAAAPPLPAAGLTTLYKQLLAVPVPVAEMAQDAEAALQLATGAAPAAAAQ